MNGKAIITRIAVLLMLPLAGLSQKKFSEDMLQNPGLYSAEFEGLFDLREIPVYQKMVEENEILLENGYAQHEFQNPGEWSPQGNRMIPLEVTVIFTKYPKHKEFWLTNYHWLLARILEALFALDPRFNSRNVDFKILLQTDCDNEPEAMQLFHGMLVKYIPVNESNNQTEEAEEDEILAIAEPKIESNPTNPAAVRKIERFMKKLPEFSDSTVYHVLERNPWENAVLVIDWTGSMYGYGAQGLMWHVENEAKSGVEEVVMFNDGDRKKKKKKVPGYTGGIYSEDATPSSKPLKLMNKVKNRGDGGDSPENDIEALFTATVNSPEAEEIILIADNHSCIRDFALLRSLSKPVRIILCGTKRGINPQYLNLAYQTGGSIHTDSLDILNLRELVSQDSLVIMGTEYTLTFNNLIMPVNRSENPYRWCDRYYQLSPRERRKVTKQRKEKEPECYVF